MTLLTMIIRFRGRVRASASLNPNLGDLCVLYMALGPLGRFIPEFESYWAILDLDSTNSVQTKLFHKPAKPFMPCVQL